MSFLKKRSPDRSPGSIFIFILSYSAQDRACYQRYERQRAVHIFAKRIKPLAEGLFYALADRLNGGLFFQHPEEHHSLYITTFSAKFPVLKLTDFIVIRIRSAGGAARALKRRTSPSEACSASATIWTETLSAACSGRSPTCGRTAPRYALTTRRRTAQARRAGTNSSRARRGRA